MVLDKTASLYARDEKGELIPQKVKLVIDEENEDHLPYENEEIFIIPMTRGEIRKMLSSITKDTEDLDSDKDGELILKYCKNPVYTAEEIPYLKKELASILVNTIFFYSGLIIRNKNKKQAMKTKEDEFGKN